MARRTFKPTVIESLETRTVPSHLTPVKVNPVHEASVAPKHTAAPTPVNAKSAHASANSSSSVTNDQLNAALTAAQAALAAQQLQLTFISTQEAIVSAQVAALSAVVLSGNVGGGGGGGAPTSPTAAQTDVAMNFSGFATILTNASSTYLSTITAYTNSSTKTQLDTDANKAATRIANAQNGPHATSDQITAVQSELEADALKNPADFTSTSGKLLTPAEVTTLTNDGTAVRNSATFKAVVAADSTLNKTVTAGLTTLANNLITSLASTGTSTSVLNFVRQSITGAPNASGVSLPTGNPSAGSLQSLLLGNTNPSTGVLATNQPGGLSKVVYDANGDSINELHNVANAPTGLVAQVVDAVEIPILFAASPNSTLPAVAFPG